MPKIKVAILGATGAVGQRFVQLLEGHPWFKVTALTGSDRTAGGTYGEGCRWVLPVPMPDYAREMPVVPTAPGLEAQIVFSTLPADLAREAEPAFAAAGHGVCSNASAHRMAPDVPLLIPEVNPEHSALIAVQRRERGWSGFIATNPNCTTVTFTVPLKALDAAFGLKRALIVSMQALSGAGYPGVASLDALDNVIPYIGGEEAKMESEPLKLLGRLDASGSVTPHPARLSAHANRVAVSDGHTVCVSAEFEQDPAVEAAQAALADFLPPDVVRHLPSAPARTLDLRPEPDRPQPRRDRDAGRGLTTSVGRVRPDPLFGLKFVCLSHNTIRGAAGGSVLNAELLVAQAWVKG